MTVGNVLKGNDGKKLMLSTPMVVNLSYMI